MGSSGMDAALADEDVGEGTETEGEEVIFPPMEADRPQPVSATSYMSPSPYPHSPSNYQPPQNPPTYQTPQNFAQPAGSAAYPPLPGYNGPSNLAHSGPYSAPATPAYPPGAAGHQHVSPPATPVMMGSIPWGTEVQAGTGLYSGAQRGNGRGHRPHSHGNHGQGLKTRHPSKRDHAAAFSKPQSSAPRTPAPPPVPSFGNPLPSKPPPAADATRKPKKRKRKHNQLGLTPKTEEHESSEEEEDVDEESKLALDGGPLQFTYKGQTATLQSSSDIAAWIAERKKKFPTQSRIDEKKKVAEEAKAARDAARQEREREKERQREQKELARKPSEEGADPAVDAAMKAQRKAEKIRRNLNREQKRFAKAEAEAEAARLKVEALQRQVLGLSQDQARQPKGTLVTESDSALSAAVDGVDPEVIDSTEPSKGAESTPTDTNPVPATTTIDVAVEGPDDAMEVSADDLVSSDWTSSSGSNSGSDSDSDVGSGSDDDSAPEEVSSRRQGPERVPPPPREGKKPVCRHYARNGHCNREAQCKFSHDVAERGVKAKPVEKKGRKGLFQALLDRQKEDENRRAMEVIVWLGQNGMLEAKNGAPQDPPSSTHA
ncbi:uncharacterized protein N7459_006797 [Penicillium hispanicum]|uniref:uncharacterized protein n=1 Tax=Penicillium hispanicum TaxID=1080232 RepID=UPI002541B123|nr:uncharacterized protein N7459_006797 [Penicillium hispanicum]KAJ5577833.1 hypothetical protein N7459_006797 [Penicillium hispanicum]